MGKGIGFLKQLHLGGKTKSPKIKKNGEKYMSMPGKSIFNQGFSGSISKALGDIFKLIVSRQETII